MERSGLLNKVKIKLDEYTPEGVSLPFGDSIGPLLDEAAIEILKTGPLHLITPSTLIFNTTKRSIASNIATLTLSTIHGLTAGDRVTISGISGVGVPDVYNGIITLTAVSTYTISYIVSYTDEAETDETGGKVLTIYYNDDKAYIPVPSNYIRLYEMKFALWKRSVRKAITTEDPDYKVQENEYIKSGYGRPSVVIVNTIINSIQNKYFECGKVINTSPTIVIPSVALYVATAKPEEINDRFSDAISWLCASKTFAIMGYQDQAKATYEQYAIEMQTLVTP